MFIYCIVHVDAHLISHLYYIQQNDTPLYWAALLGRTAVVQLLLQAGADEDTKDKVSAY
jgi:ankyrin repeat protein